jgi:hypothetical protein
VTSILDCVTEILVADRRGDHLDFSNYTVDYSVRREVDRGVIVQKVMPVRTNVDESGDGLREVE